MDEITIYDRLPKACPTCGSDEPTIYYGSCFGNVHDALFDPRLPMDPWHAYMNELRYLHKAVDGMTVSYEVCRDLLVEVRAERDALAHWKTEAIKVLEAWDDVHEALGSPARLGESTAEASLAEVRRLKADLLDFGRKVPDDRRKALVAVYAYEAGLTDGRAEP